MYAGRSGAALARAPSNSTNTNRTGYLTIMAASLATSHQRAACSSKTAKREFSSRADSLRACQVSRQRVVQFRTSRNPHLVATPRRCDSARESPFLTCMDASAPPSLLIKAAPAIHADQSRSVHMQTAVPGIRVVEGPHYIPWTKEYRWNGRTKGGSSMRREHLWSGILAYSYLSSLSCCWSAAAAVGTEAVHRIGHLQQSQALQPPRTQ